MNLQLNNTSVYLGGQCKWDIIIGKEDDDLVIQDFHLSPLSPVVPYNPQMNYLINNSHGYNLKTFYKEIEGYFWNTDYFIDNQSNYDISRYAGPRRRESYSNYKKQFEYLCPVWLDKIDGKLKFTFNTYLDKEHKTQVGSKSVVFESNGKEGFHDKFLSYFKDWIDKIHLTYKPEDEVVGNDKVMYVDFENKVFKISGVNVESGELSDDIELNYVIDNLTMFERPLIETDNMLSELFKNYHLVTSQLFNFNFCFNLEDIVSSYIIHNVVANPLYIDMTVSIGDEALERKDIFTNYTDINKYVVNNFIPLSKVRIDYDEQTLDVPSDEDMWEVDGDSLSKNVLDYLKDYDYPEFYGLNKLTQDILHWNYLGSNKTFNIYNGYRGVLQSPVIDSNGDLEVNDNNKYEYKEYYDNFSNEYACDVSRKAYIDSCNSLGWVQPGKIVYISGSAMSTLQNYMSDVFDRWGITLGDVKSYWNDTMMSDDEKGVKDIKLLLVYYPGYRQYYINFTVDKIGDNYIIYTTDINDFLLPNLISKMSEPLPEFVNLKKLLQYIYDVVVKSNVTGLSINFGTEIYGAINTENEWDFFKSSNHITFPVRSSGTLTISTISKDSHNQNIKFNINEDCDDIVKINDSPSGYEQVWDNEGYVINLLTYINFAVEVDADEPWLPVVKEKLGEIYNISDTNKIDYIYSKYDTAINYEHGDEDTIIYDIKMNLL